MNPYTKKWLNTKCAFIWHFLEKSKEGKEIHDVMKNDWPMFRGHTRRSCGIRLNEKMARDKKEMK